MKTKRCAVKYNDTQQAINSDVGIKKCLKGTKET